MSNRELPKRFFKDGAEPNGERVHHYSELSYIDKLTDALLPDERETLNNSQFGKVLQIPKGAAYSGKLVHFLLTRQLVVKKKHEIWILFAGSPIRFSISEFQSLTGLSCTKLPKAKKKSGKRKIVPGKYWFKLFDRADVSVDWVVNRLKKRLVKDRDTRLSFALLALVDGVLCPTSGKSKICPTHVELLEDIAKFLDYPWGTTSFNMTLTSIQARGAEKLKRKSVTIQGFPYALQLLILQTVPVVNELHFPQEDHSEDSDSEDITNDMVRLWTMKLDLVLKVNGKESCSVVHMIEGPTTSASPPQCIWSDEEDDDSVDLMLQFIKEGNKFSGSMFGGGLLPEEGNDEINENSDNGSTDDSRDETNGRKKRSVPSTAMNDQRKSEVSIQATMNQYVDMKVKRSENRVLKALVEAEQRLSHTIAKSISEAQPCKQKKASSNPTWHSSMKRKRSVHSEKEGSSDKSGSGFFDDGEDQPSFPCPSARRTPLNIPETAGLPNLKESHDMRAIVGPLQVPFTEIFLGQETLNVSTSQQTKQHLNVSPLPSQLAANPSTRRTRSNGAGDGIVTQAPTVDVRREQVCKEDTVTQQNHQEAVNGSNSIAIVHSNSSGYDLLQVQKLIRITSPDRVIDFGGGRTLSSSAIRDIIELKKDFTNEETDIIFNAIRHSWETDPAKRSSKFAAFRDSSFGTSIIQHYTKFWRASDKGMFEFDNSLSSSCPLASRETKLKTALKPLSIMIPYLVRFAASNSREKGVDFKPLGIIRDKAIPQACYGRHSGIMSANLGDAHTLGGVVLCQLIKITDVFDSAKRYIIDAYEAVNGPA